MFSVRKNSKRYKGAQKKHKMEIESFHEIMHSQKRIIEPRRRFLVHGAAMLREVAQLLCQPPMLILWSPLVSPGKHFEIGNYNS